MHEMRREYRCGIADAEIDLALREILYVEQTRPSQIGVRQDSAIKIGIVENCATQVRARKMRIGFGAKLRHRFSMAVGQVVAGFRMLTIAVWKDSKSSQSSSALRISHPRWSQRRSCQKPGSTQSRAGGHTEGRSPTAKIAESFVPTIKQMSLSATCPASSQDDYLCHPCSYCREVQIHLVRRACHHVSPSSGSANRAHKLAPEHVSRHRIRFRAVHRAHVSHDRVRFPL